MSMTTKIAWLTDEQLEMFKSDFKVVARFFVNKRRNPDYVADDPTEIQHVDEVLKLLSVMTGLQSQNRNGTSNTHCHLMCMRSKKI